jgi:hypothetical protein
MKRKKCGAAGFTPNFQKIKELNEKQEPIFPWQKKRRKTKVTDYF